MSAYDGTQAWRWADGKAGHAGLLDEADVAATGRKAKICSDNGQRKITCSAKPNISNSEDRFTFPVSSQER